MKLFKFVFLSKSNSCISLCILLLLLFSPTTLYAAELPTAPIENIPLPTEEAPDETTTIIPPMEGPEEILTEELLPPELPTVDSPIPETPSTDDIMIPNIPSTDVSFTVTPTDGTYYITSSGGLNVRNGPSIQYDIIGILPYGEEIVVTGKVADDWFEISYQGKNAYISAKYVSAAPVTPLPLETEEAPETLIDEAEAEQNVMPLIPNTTMVLLLLAIVAIIVVIVITVFSFFHNQHKYEYYFDDNDDSIYDDTYYDDNESNNTND